MKQLRQNIKFSQNCPKFYIFTKIIIFLERLDKGRPTASTLHILFIYFFIFATYELLNTTLETFIFHWWK